MRLISICFIILYLVIPCISSADTVDFRKTIFSGKYTAIPTPPTPPATGGSTNTKKNNNSQAPDPTNTAPDIDDAINNNSYGSNFIHLDNSISSAPSMNYSPTSPSLPSSSGKAAIDTNYGPPSKSVLTDDQKQILADEKKNNEEQLKKFNKELSENYDTYTFPKQYYNRPFGKQNSHLPPVAFASYYAALAFKYVQEDNHINVRYFTEKYNFVDVVNSDGGNLLMTAVAYNSIKSARMLLMKNIFYINEQNQQNKKTSLHYAIDNNNMAMTKLLLTMGASPMIRDINDMTPLDYALANDNAELANILLSYKHPK